MILLNPIPDVRLQSIIATIMAPLCEINAIFPSGGMCCENEEFNGVCESVVPKLLGPITLIPYSFAIATSSASRSAPSPPISLNPAVITTIFLTPYSPHSFTMPFTPTLGIEIITKSGTSGMSETFL